MKALKNKMGKNGGFTLVEMLIVVAIIAILIAISIPLVNSALEKSRDSTDAANERAAKAEALVIHMGVYAGSDLADKQTALRSTTGGLYYDAVTGSLEIKPDKIVRYGKCTCDENAAEGKFLSQWNGIHENRIIIIRVNSSTGETTIQWANAGVSK